MSARRAKAKPMGRRRALEPTKFCPATEEELIRGVMRKHPQMTQAEARIAFRDLQRSHLIERAPDGSGYFIHSFEYANELCRADANIYKTPGGHFVSIDDEDGGYHFFNPEEAKLWQIDGQEVDRRIGLGIPPDEDEGQP